MKLLGSSLSLNPKIFLSFAFIFFVVNIQHFPFQVLVFIFWLLDFNLQLLGASFPPQLRLFNIYSVKRRSQSKLRFHLSCPTNIGLSFDNILNQTNKLNCTCITLYNSTIHGNIRTRDNKGTQGFYFGLQQLRSTLVQALTIQITEQTNFNSYKWNKQTVHI